MQLTTIKQAVEQAILELKLRNVNLRHGKPEKGEVLVVSDDHYVTIGDQPEVTNVETLKKELLSLIQKKFKAIVLNLAAEHYRIEIDAAKRSIYGDSFDPVEVTLSLMEGDENAKSLTELVGEIQTNRKEAIADLGKLTTVKAIREYATKADIGIGYYINELGLPATPTAE